MILDCDRGKLVANFVGEGIIIYIKMWNDSRGLGVGRGEIFMILWGNGKRDVRRW